MCTVAKLSFANQPTLCISLDKKPRCRSTNIGARIPTKLATAVCRLTYVKMSACTYYQILQKQQQKIGFSLALASNLSRNVTLFTKRHAFHETPRFSSFLRVRIASSNYDMIKRNCTTSLWPLLVRGMNVLRNGKPMRRWRTLARSAGTISSGERMPLMRYTGAAVFFQLFIHRDRNLTEVTKP